MAKNERKKKTKPAVRKGPAKAGKTDSKKSKTSASKRTKKDEPLAKGKIHVRKTPVRGKNKDTRIRSGVRSRSSELDELQELFLQALTKQAKKRGQRRVPSVPKTKGKRKSQKETGDRSKPRTLKGAEIRMERKAGDNLIYIKFKTKSMQQLIIGLNNNEFSEFEQMTMPNTEFAPYYLVIILKIKKPHQKEPFYISFKSNVLSAISEVELMKEFILETISRYNNDMADMIDEKYDEPIQVYKILEIGVRFIYPVIPKEGREPLVIK